jgi:hypothetical protein
MKATVTALGPVDWAAHNRRYSEYLRKRLSPEGTSFEEVAGVLDCQFAENPEDLPRATFTYNPDNPQTPRLEGKPTKIVASQKYLVWYMVLDNGEVARVQLSMMRRSPSGLDFLVWTLLRHVCRQYFPRTREVDV